MEGYDMFSPRWTSCSDIINCNTQCVNVLQYVNVPAGKSDKIQSEFYKINFSALPQGIFIRLFVYSFILLSHTQDIDPNDGGSQSHPAT